ncbi:hypothetical protein N7G274_003392 [Stereocaulon virgatum]|uniref:Cytochrome P450 n=1 Tax=Stereocaulon virgatum TaxID=373712 RepID=A0ABR4ADH7_9LECA
MNRIAGSETTATTLSCASYYLFKNPRVLRMLQQEIRSAFKTYDEIDGTSTIPLKYLSAVALEAMRIYPPLPFALPRVVSAGGDTVDGHFLPEGTVVSTSPFAASMDSTNFHDPWEFIPERWLGQSKGDELEASQPFSLGTRGCLGRSLGWLELRTILAKLHFSYNLALLDGHQDVDWQRDSQMHTLWKKPKLMVKATRRH